MSYIKKSCVYMSYKKKLCVYMSFNIKRHMYTSVISIVRIRGNLISQLQNIHASSWVVCGRFAHSTLNSDHIQMYRCTTCIILMRTSHFIHFQNRRYTDCYRNSVKFTRRCMQAVSWPVKFPNVSCHTETRRQYVRLTCNLRLFVMDLFSRS